MVRSGYSLRVHLDGFLVLLNIRTGKIMEKKADKVRDLITSKGTRPQIALAIMERCKADPSINDWKTAATRQTQEVLGIYLLSARAMVSEYSVDDLSSEWPNWLKQLDNLDL